MLDADEKLAVRHIERALSLVNGALEGGITATSALQSLVEAQAALECALEELQ